MAAINLTFEKLPSPLVGFARAAVARRPGLKQEETIPAIRASLHGLTPDPDHVQRYASICGDQVDGSLPLTYPHVLASPMHMAVMTHKAFPLRLPGLVHVANKIHRRQAIPLAQSLDIDVQVEGHRDVERGLEFDLITRISASDGDLLWDSSSTMLYRQPGKGGKKSASSTPPDLSHCPELGRWSAPANIGRRYGWMAGDINPIHLSGLTAKLFGFPQAIAHGMWSLASCAARLQAEAPIEAVVLDVAFKRPLLLPGEAVLLRLPEESNGAFALTDPAREERFLTGRHDRLEDSE